MAQVPDVVWLTQGLVRIQSVNPPGDEERCASWLATVLREHGFKVELHAFGERRFNLVAEMEGAGGGPVLGFSGHLDTVPLGAAPWSEDPFGGEIKQGLLYGRGSTDMKSGVAAFIVACVQAREAIRRSSGVRLLLTGGEETGCEGARALRAHKGESVSGLGALIVGEPTQNYPFVGHKGALWLRGSATGITAHGSMPETGENAIYKVVDAINELRHLRIAGTHQLMGGPTVNVGAVSGGVNVNSVPDSAAFEVDIRTVPGLAHGELQRFIEERLGKEIQLAAFVDVPPLESREAHPWVKRVFDCCAPYHAEALSPKVVPYFTDGSVLAPASDALPVVILGPGEPHMMHKTDEYCRVDRLHEAVHVYGAVLRDWADSVNETPVRSYSESPVQAC